MKKHFNINKIIAITIVFVCFLMFSDKVKALECKYSSPQFSGNSDYNDKLYFVIDNTNGSYTYKFYDETTNSYYSPTDSHITDFYKILFNTGSDVAGHSIDNVEANLQGGSSISLDNGTCPSQIYTVSTADPDDMSIVWLTFYTSKDNTNYKAYASATGCENSSDNYYACKTRALKKDSGSANMTDDSLICKYSYYSFAKDNGYDNYIVIDFNEPFSVEEQNGVFENVQFGFVDEFTSDYVGDTCPNLIYIEETNSVYKIKPFHTSKVDKKLGRVKTAHMSEWGGSSGDSGSFCDTSKGTKIIKYARMIYTILRYSIPALIVIFSTAEFLGVVFTGDQEKMQKAKKHFVWRIVIGLIIMLAPLFVEFILRLAGIIDKDLVDVVCEII